MQTERWCLSEIEQSLACALANLYVRGNADNYSPRGGPEMDEKRANEKRLSEERFESSPEVNKVLNNNNNNDDNKIMMIEIIISTQ